MKFITTEIKSYDCIEHDPIDEWIPEEPDLVSFWCCISIGIKGQEGFDYFQVHVVTSRMLSQITDKKYTLVLPYYENFQQVIDVINQQMELCKNINWVGFTEEFSKIYHWEYSGY